MRGGVLTPSELALMNRILDAALSTVGVDRKWWEENGKSQTAVACDIRCLCVYYMIHEYRLKTTAVGAFFKRTHATVSMANSKFRAWLLDSDTPQRQRLFMEQRLDVMHSIVNGTITEEVAATLNDIQDQFRTQAAKKGKPTVIMKCALWIGEIPMGFFWCELGDPASLNGSNPKMKELTASVARKLIEERGLVKVDRCELDASSKLAEFGEEIYDTPDRDYLMSYKDFFRREELAGTLLRQSKEPSAKVPKTRKKYTKKSTCERWAKAIQKQQNS